MSKNIGDCKCLNKNDKHMILNLVSDNINNKHKKLEKLTDPQLYSDIRKLVNLRDRIEEIPEC